VDHSDIVTTHGDIVTTTLAVLFEVLSVFAIRIPRAKTLRTAKIAELHILAGRFDRFSDVGLSGG